MQRLNYTINVTDYTRRSVSARTNAAKFTNNYLPGRAFVVVLFISGTSVLFVFIGIYSLLPAPV